MASQRNDKDADEVLEEGRAGNQITLAGKDPDKTYASEFKRFKKFVLEDENLTTVSAPFITRENINHYFTRVIAVRLGVRNTIGRVVNALQWFADNREYLGSSTHFIVKNKVVEEALAAQFEFNQINGGTSHPGSDPHHGLKDMILVSEL